MKKSLKAVFVVLAMLFTANVYAEESDFDWSQCWCNYGAGIKEGNLLVSVDGALDYGFFNYVGNGYWNIPTVIVDVEVAKKVWELPFSFGGYAGFNAFGAKYDTYSYSTMNFVGGASATYHILLPVEELDVYATTKAGFIIHTYQSKNYSDYSGNPFNLQFATNIGASYYFNDTVGINLEFGWPYEKFGLQLKF